jgi:hypothetical protein
MSRSRAGALRPVDRLRRLVVSGLTTAIIAAGVVAVLHTFETSRDCQGAFSRGFSSGFDRYHCDLHVRIINGPEIAIPSP